MATPSVPLAPEIIKDKLKSLPEFAQPLADEHEALRVGGAMTNVQINDLETPEMLVIIEKARTLYAQAATLGNTLAQVDTLTSQIDGQMNHVSELSQSLKPTLMVVASSLTALQSVKQPEVRIILQTSLTSFKKINSTIKNIDQERVQFQRLRQSALLERAETSKQVKLITLALKDVLTGGAENQSQRLEAAFTKLGVQKTANGFTYHNRQYQDAKQVLNALVSETTSMATRSGELDRSLIKGLNRLVNLNDLLQQEATRFDKSITEVQKHPVLSPTERQAAQQAKHANLQILQVAKKQGEQLHVAQKLAAQLPGATGKHLPVQQDVQPRNTGATLAETLRPLVSPSDFLKSREDISVRLPSSGNYSIKSNSKTNDDILRPSAMQLTSKRWENQRQEAKHHLQRRNQQEMEALISKQNLKHLKAIALQANKDASEKKISERRVQEDRESKI